MYARCEHREPTRCQAIRAGPDRATGFTLLEVMVVVAVIALLVAVLLPSLSSARRQAKDLVCQTNLRSIAQAWHAYLVASNGKFLKSKKGKDNEQINYGGKQGDSKDYRGEKPLNRYLNLPVITDYADSFKCPFDRGAGWIRPTCFDQYGSSYLMNTMLVGPKTLTVGPDNPCKDVLAPMSDRIENLNISELANEAKLLLVGDYGWYNAWQPEFEPQWHIDWHRKPMHHNIAFMDGHVKYTHIHKGLYTTGDYTLIPFKQEQSEICGCQVEVTYPPPPEE